MILASFIKNTGADFNQNTKKYHESTYTYHSTVIRGIENVQTILALLPQNAKIDLIEKYAQMNVPNTNTVMYLHFLDDTHVHNAKSWQVNLVCILRFQPIDHVSEHPCYVFIHAHDDTSVHVFLSDIVRTDKCKNFNIIELTENSTSRKVLEDLKKDKNTEWNGQDLRNSNITTYFLDGGNRPRTNEGEEQEGGDNSEDSSHQSATRVNLTAESTGVRGHVDVSASAGVSRSPSITQSTSSARRSTSVDASRSCTSRSPPITLSKTARLTNAISSFLANGLIRRGKYSEDGGEVDSDDDNSDIFFDAIQEERKEETGAASKCKTASVPLPQLPDALAKKGLNGCLQGSTCKRSIEGKELVAKNGYASVDVKNMNVDIRELRAMYTIFRRELTNVRYIGA